MRWASLNRPLDAAAAIAKIVDDAEPLLACCDFPAEHWVHLKTTNPIELTFATVRLRTKGHHGARLPSSRPRHGLQAHRSGRATVAIGQRPHTSSRSSEPAPSSTKG
jgi:hypothetical protein